ncbi:MAG: RidA family protein [Nitrospinota bacterium]|nr:RidA family protein [Nitrospinota bacterium]MDH5756585.1 RidA family protein [Nitrospinota bacterium]
MPKKIIQTDKAPRAVGPYSQAVRIGDLVYTSGQLGLDPATGQFVGDDVESQTRQALDNLEAVLRAAGLSFSNVVKCTVFLVDMGDFKKVNAIYAERLGAQDSPARSAVQVAALPLGGLVEIEMIAAGAE